jgi:hypothetical protein
MTPQERKSVIEKITQLREEMIYRLEVIQEEFIDTPQTHKKYGPIMSNVVDLTDALDITLDRLVRKLLKAKS